MSNAENKPRRFFRRPRLMAVGVGSMFGLAALAVGLLLGAVEADAATPAADAAPPVTSAQSAPAELMAADPLPIEPISAVLEESTRPLVLSVFVVSAVTLGAGGIVAARLIAHNRSRVPVRSAARDSDTD